MKKIICVILAAAMLLLTSCGKVETNETPNNESENNISITSTEEEIETEEEIVIEEEEEIEEETEEEQVKYILNTNSYKIHYTWCYSVDRMKEYNKEYSNETIETLIDRGYSPCGNCKPN